MLEKLDVTFMIRSKLCSLLAGLKLFCLLLRGRRRWHSALLWQTTSQECIFWESVTQEYTEPQTKSQCWFGAKTNLNAC